MLRHLIAVGVIAAWTPVGMSDEPKPVPKGFITPEPDNIPEDLRKPGPLDEKYPIPQDPAKAAKRQAEKVKWYRDRIVDPFEKLGNTRAPCADKARKALNAAVAYMSAGDNYYIEIRAFELAV